MELVPVIYVDVLCVGGNLLLVHRIPEDGGFPPKHVGVSKELYL
jgi:hypothetical protein